MEQFRSKTAKYRLSLLTMLLLFLGGGICLCAANKDYRYCKRPGWRAADWGKC